MKAVQLLLKVTGRAARTAPAGDLTPAHRQGYGSLRPEPGVRQRTSLTASALRDEVIDLGFEDASWFDPDLLEEPLDLQADDPVNAGPGKKAEEQHPRVIR